MEETSPSKLQIHASDTSKQVLYTLTYVAPFYLSSKTRPSRTLSRDAPSVIRARIASVTLTCVVCTISTFLILTARHEGSGAEPTTSARSALHSMGWWPVGLAEAGKTLLLTAVLFLGPLFEMLVVHGGWRDWLKLRPLYELFGEWTTWRNIVAVSYLPLPSYLVWLAAVVIHSPPYVPHI